MELFLTIDILYITANFGNFGYSFDILTFDLLLKPPQPATGLFLEGIFMTIPGLFEYFSENACCQKSKFSQ